jgi:hypothetical protein
MTTTVVTTDEFAAWYRALPAEQADAVDFSVTLLEEQGVALGHPHSSGFPGLRHGVRELRVQSRRFPIRMFYAFNPARQAVLIIAGNKKGEHDESKWTAKMAKRAERIFDEYLGERGWERDPD